MPQSLSLQGFPNGALGVNTTENVVVSFSVALANLSTMTYYNGTAWGPLVVGGEVTAVSLAPGGLSATVSIKNVTTGTHTLQFKETSSGAQTTLYSYEVVNVAALMDGGTFTFAIPNNQVLNPNPYTLWTMAPVGFAYGFQVAAGKNDGQILAIVNANGTSIQATNGAAGLINIARSPINIPVGESAFLVWSGVDQLWHQMDRSASDRQSLGLMSLYLSGSTVMCASADEGNTTFIPTAGLGSIFLNNTTGASATIGLENTGLTGQKLTITHYYDSRYLNTVTIPNQNTQSGFPSVTLSPGDSTSFVRIPGGWVNVNK